MQSLYADVHSRLLEDLGDAWPQVQQITVGRSTGIMLFDRQSGWSLEGGGSRDSWFTPEDVFAVGGALE